MQSHKHKFCEAKKSIGVSEEGENSGKCENAIAVFPQNFQELMKVIKIICSIKTPWHGVLMKHKAGVEIYTKIYFLCSNNPSKEVH